MGRGKTRQEPACAAQREFNRALNEDGAAVVVSLPVEQDLSDAVTVDEVTEKLGLHNLRYRHSQSACAGADDGFSRVWTESLAHTRRGNETVTTECVSICNACAESTDGVSVRFLNGRVPKGTVRGGSVDITHQHFTHDQHIAHIPTVVFSISVVVSVVIVCRCPCLLLVS